VPTVNGCAADANAVAGAPPSVFDSDVGDGAKAPPPPPTATGRSELRAERGAQDGDLVGPLLHAAELQQQLLRLYAAHPGVS